MDRQAEGLAGAGALLAAFSLILPWYTVQAQGMRFGGESGWEALGGLSWLVLGLALLAGWRAARQVAAPAALALLVLIGWRFSVPPEATSLFGEIPGGAFEAAIASAVTDQIGLELQPTYGMAVAAAGAALAAYASLRGRRA